MPEIVLSNRNDPGIDPVIAGTPLPPSGPRSTSAATEPLARIEEKTARIEEKFARSEALLQRLEAQIETSTGRVAEAARQSDLIAVRDHVTGLTRRVARVPGFGALMVMSLVTAILTAAITLALVKYLPPGLLTR